MNKWTFHGNMQAYWGYPGASNELDVYDNAYAAYTDQERIDLADQISEYEGVRAGLKDKDAYKLNTSVNLAVSRTFGKADNINARLGVQNLFADYREYAYSASSKASYPDRMRWMKDPMSIRLSVTLKY
jgi:hypothetical protein